MYEWLDQEIREIKTKDFHVVESSRAKELQRLPKGIYLKLPPSYVAFVEKFGAAKLYKQGEYYLVGVLSLPEIEKKGTGEELLRIGHFDDAPSFFKISLLQPETESPVFEQDEDLEQIAETFEQWLVQRCGDARATYKEKWQQIQRGADPFTASEAAIVEARKKFKWHVDGVTENGDLRIAVTNDSDATLPYLTLGVTAKDNSLKGKMWLDVSQIKPGETSIVTHPAYKELVPSENVLVEQLPDPTPDDRQTYWEFKK